ncbi:MAG: cytochrome-c peroxidase [Flavobacteriales bacterium]|nr:cytochrome-c peroxidase [Flavobacteriales bacterium]
MLLISCGTNEAKFVFKIPNGFDEPDLMGDKELTYLKVSLGEKLFFDPLLSSDSTISCGSCHQPNLAFTDGKRLSTGVNNRKGKRNSPTLLNLAWSKRLLADGGVNSIETQMLVPISDHNEMNSSIPQIIQKLNRDEYYIEVFHQVFDRKPDAFGLTRAISAYIRTLVSGNSRWDAFVAGDTAALSVEEKNGMDLFYSSELNCTSCHSGYLFTNHTFQNNGLYLNYQDSGRALITYKSEDLNKFKVPTLRNIELTAPYMHDGNFNSLEKVVEHYSKGGEPHMNKSSKISPLDLTCIEKQELVAFLKSLTDLSIINQ